MTNDNVFEQFLVGSSELKCYVSRKTRSRQWIQFEPYMTNISSGASRSLSSHLYILNFRNGYCRLFICLCVFLLLAACQGNKIKFR